MIRVVMTKISSTDRVAYLGPEGTYSHAALLKFFGAGQHCHPVDEIPSVFNCVNSAECTYGLVPVENSTEGSITQTLDCFGNFELIIVGEVMLRIEHCLLASPATVASGITQIVSHQQSLGQCRHWLEQHFPKIDKVSLFSNAEAAKKAANEPGVAAIAGRTAAKIYGLAILHENIEDVHDNTTRFVVISRDNAPAPSGRDKSSLIIATRNEPGALFDALEPFKNHAVNLIKLESRPTRKEAWSYTFFVDIDGHCKNDNIREALAEVSRHVLECRLLGSYPAAVND
jgi:chorismate mutase/prephenate dehydratase